MYIYKQVLQLDSFALVQNYATPALGIIHHGNSIYTYIYIFLYIRIYEYIFIYVYIYVYMYMYTCVYVYIHIHIYMYIYIRVVFSIYMCGIYMNSVCLTHTHKVNY